MRLIHTSDWHLGRTLHGESLLEHAAGSAERLVLRDAVEAAQRAEALA
jgi:DNA repair exonuclease SbcCD nuclease subunit